MIISPRDPDGHAGGRRPGSYAITCQCLLPLKLVAQASSNHKKLPGKQCKAIHSLVRVPGPLAGKTEKVKVNGVSHTG